MSRYPANIITKSPATPTGPNPITGRAPGVWRMEDVAYWLKQGVWPDASADGYWPYTSLLLSSTSLSNANNNLFVDSSGAFNPISRNGNTTQGSFSPYGSYWSNYFDGSGDYLQTPSNAAFALSGTSFTIEAWVYVTSSSEPYQHVVKTSGASNNLMYIDYSGGSNGVLASSQVGGTIASQSGVTLNTWHHLAVVRNGTSVTSYVNGVGGTPQTIDPGGSGSVSLIIATDGGPSPIRYFNGLISNVRVVKGTAVYTANFTPPAAPLTAISGTSLLTCQSNRFIDNSSNAFAITVNGDTKVQKFSPFTLAAPGVSYNQSDITNWSGYFDGSGDLVSTPTSSALGLTSDWTVETWVYPTSYAAAANAFFDSRAAGTGCGLYYSLTSYTGGPGAVGYATNSALVAVSTFAIPLFAWTHIAFTRSGNTITCYINGTSNFTYTDTRTFASSTNYDLGNSTHPPQGYMAGYRVVRGTAVYTGNFTPPTSPLTAVSGTSLLTMQDAAFTDRSTNNLVLSVSGNPTVTGNSPFNTVGYWSNYFDGSSTFSFSSISLAADFTIEAWVYYTSTSGNPTLLGENPPNNQSLRRLSGKHYFYRQGASITGTIDIPTNQWVHLAATRSGGTVRIFTNGVLDGSGSISGAFSVNCFGGVDTGTDRLTGYASNVRIVDGTALYTATFTVPTSPLTAVSGTTLLTAQNGTFKDNSTNNRTLTRNGSPTVQTFDPFYTSTIASNGGSLYLDGSGDYLTSPTSVAYDFASSNFTIEGWFYFTNSTANAVQTMFSNYTSFPSAGSIFYGKHTNNSGYVTVWFSNYSTGGPLLAETTYPPNNAWTHYALVRNGNTFTLYRNGVSTASASWSGAATSGANAIWVGAAGDAATSYNFPGYMSGFRITKGVAVYTAAFTPPTAPVTPTAATTLLLNGMNAGAYDATTINDMETVGNAQVSTVQSKFGGSSMYFDGTGDWLTTASNNTLSMGTGNFTAEMWVYPTSVTSYRILIDNSWDTATYAWQIFINAGTVSVYAANGAGANLSVDSTVTVSANVWTHIAVVKSGTTVTIYLNGTASGSGTMNTTFGRDAVNYVGAQAGTPYAYEGYIDDLRITKGVARYTANFTPPTQAFPVY